MSVRAIMEFVRGGAYLSLQDAYKRDDVRDALRAGDVDRASRLADRVYRRLTLVGEGTPRNEPL